MSRKSMQRQSGHAALLFALIIPILFGVFALGTDGARAVQDKARLLEAVEVASLAVAGEGSDDKVLAKSYLQYYFPLAEINDDDITINKINCEDNPACQGQDRRFFEYQVSARISQPTWFPGNDAIIGFGSDYKVYDGSVTRKYHSETVDIVLVADFSASMHNTWKGGSKRKFLDLKDIVNEIATELEQFNSYNTTEKKNKLAIVGFDFYTVRRNDANQRVFYDHLICNNSSGTEVRCHSRYPGNDFRVRYTDENRNLKINAQATVRDVFNLSSIAHQPVNDPITNISIFEDVNLTDDMKKIREIVSSNTFSISGSTGSGTSFYAGLIRAAQIVKNGDNPRRLIILLSDGEDSFYHTTNKLINPDLEDKDLSNPTPSSNPNVGLCNVILNTLNSLETSDGSKVTARMVAVGFDYNINQFPQMKNCVGEDNVFSADDRDAIKNKILELITEEIGHLAPQR
ncbi:TadE/TadG family protein [Vibrio metschnikovii]|uniref:Pilus assembly protein n=1 Tax=bacterium 19PA01SH03 TaxID=2920705 RepID=A0AAU6SQL5_UNCXX|nr:TadE/TadG family protein [Vibrio metschnikovii]EKO3748862.1 TadE/TadG family protein [Vibrio metschnikovii]EKO3787299.1 TadE/TadG family protein [Vibrio metschnikovii]EKO3873529.1 TadE/TadG family protein [Vibrio metschnikovii]EKO3876722.1 TadE/TadG family protein [Vibrio metschnikovii]